MIRKAVMHVLVILLASFFLSCMRLGKSEATVIRLDPSHTFQTISGWEATAWIGQNDFPNLFGNWKERMLDLAANDLGINRVRVEITSGAENPVDYLTPYLNGQISRDEWRSHWYEIINDNDDPNTINWSGFQFSRLDRAVDNVVLPLAQRLREKGEKLYINVCYVDFGCCRKSSRLRHKDFPEEYAEFVLATYLHLRDKYNIVPDAWEVVLEPDNGTGWTSRQMGDAIVAAGGRLKASGFKPNFIAPSTTSMANAVSFFDQLIQVPEVLQYVSEFSYHRYADVSKKNLQAISDRAMQHQIRTAMLEHIASGYEDLHEDLKVGRNSTWSQYTIGDAWPGDNGGKYYLVDASDPQRPVVTMASRTRFLRQYFKYVRSGALRIDAATNNNDFDPLAFINSNGRYVVVVKASTGGSISIQNLPAGTYGIKGATASPRDIDAPDVTVASGQPLITSIPEAGVITVYAKEAQTNPTQ